MKHENNLSTRAGVDGIVLHLLTDVDSACGGLVKGEETKMSAYIVNKNHIVYLVAAAQSRSLNRCGGNFTWYHANNSHGLSGNDYDRAAEVANMLMCENIKSVSARYPNESSASLPGPINRESVIKARDFTHGHWDRFDPVQVLNSIRCLNYQSCEHDGWQGSEAHAFLESLKGAAIDSLPGMQDAIWGAPEKSSSTSVSLSSLCR